MNQFLKRGFFGRNEAYASPVRTKLAVRIMQMQQTNKKQAQLWCAP
jgi:hypothetical protein